jgi:hypothetical protein
MMQLRRGAVKALGAGLRGDAFDVAHGVMFDTLLMLFQRFFSLKSSIARFASETSIFISLVVMVFVREMLHESMFVNEVAVAIAAVKLRYMWWGFDMVIQC